MSKLVARLEEPRGQTMAEYGVVLAVVTLVVSASLLILSGSITGAFSAAAGILP
jgi:Flp pilus assembly pilin Flp